ncbi:MAG TPA: GNAT family N-acetyltransferase [Tepiditoga sp.]|nr:GNAT family N-acetyltransferase [Tepiditoga sp.]
MYTFYKIKDVSEVVLLNLVNEVFSDYIVPVNWTINSFKRDIKEYSISSEESFIVFEDEKPVGFSIVSVRGLRGRIDSFGVLKDRRGTGLASEILKRTTESLKWKGIHNIILEVEQNEKRPINFYEKHGFRMKRKLETLILKTNENDKNIYKYMREDAKWIHEISLDSNMSIKRKPNWQREPKTLHLSDDRYFTDRVTDAGYTIGYVVWGENTENYFIVDIAPIADSTKYDEIVSDFLKKISSGNKPVIIVALPEDDILCGILKNKGFETFITQIEMEKNIH